MALDRQDFTERQFHDIMEKERKSDSFRKSSLFVFGRSDYDEVKRVHKTLSEPSGLMLNFGNEIAENKAKWQGRRKKEKE